MSKYNKKSAKMSRVAYMAEVAIYNKREENRTIIPNDAAIAEYVEEWKKELLG
jgi:hypothetical protein